MRRAGAAMIKPSIFCKVLISGLVWQAATCCCATVLYDNLGNVRTGTDTIRGVQARGIRFNTDSSLYNQVLATLLLSADRSQGPATLALYSDVNSTLGNQIGLFFPPSSFSANGLAPATFMLESGRVLTPNTAYWLVLQNFASPSFGVNWSWTIDSSGSGAGFTSLEAKTNDGGATWTYPNAGAPDQARIEAFLLPEPPSVVLGLIAIILLVFSAGRRMRGNSF
jgi:hypothetical protein